MKKSICVLLFLLVALQTNYSVKAYSKDRWFVPKLDKIAKVDEKSVKSSDSFIHRWFIQPAKKVELPNMNQVYCKVSALVIDAYNLKIMKDFEEKSMKDFAIVVDTGFEVIKEQKAGWENIGINPKEFE